MKSHNTNLWTCPRCGQKFVNRNQSHSCGSYTVDDFLRHKSEKAVDLFNHFLSEYRKIGRFDLHPVKTRVALTTQIRFCAINKIGDDFIDVHFVLTKEYHCPCFYKIDNLGDRFFVHHLRIHDRSDICSEVKKYMRLAYQVGNRKHIDAKTGKIRRA